LPNHPTATLLLGIGYRLAGDTIGAMRVLGALTLRLPRWGPPFFEHGMALLESGLREEALACLKRAVYLEPRLPDAWRTIGDIHTGQGDIQAADEAYARHIQTSTLDPRLMSAARALVENLIPQAEFRLREHLKQFPTDVAAIRMLAEVAGRLGRFGDAEKLLTRAVELAPSFYPARHNLALVLHRQNKYAAALAQIDILIAAQPRDSSHRNLKALVLAKIGEYPQSLEIYADVLDKHPDQARIWESYAHALSSAGRIVESIAAYRRCIELMPHDGHAFWSLANLKTFRFSEAEVLAMRALLTDPATPMDSQAPLHFAIGKALEDAGNYENSFTHYALGNELRRHAVGYEPAETSAQVKRSSAFFTRQFMGSRAHLGDPAFDPIFIVGLPRAGSTLIEQILASHSLIEGTMELANIMTMASVLGGRKGRVDHSAYPEILASLSAHELRELGAQYLRETRIQRKTGKPYFIDKMPNNFLHVGLIRLALPNAKIIDARRHPMSCCFSGFKQNFAMGQRFTYSLEHLGRYYRDYVALMAHFEAADPGAVYRVTYERMVEDTESEVRRLLDFLGVPFEAACLRFYENERAVRTASAHQVRQPIYREGMEQWRHFEPWLGPLKETLGEVLDNYPGTPVIQTPDTAALSTARIGASGSA
jgi:tetratricopeptide (TPR) repeat protein